MREVGAEWQFESVQSPEFRRGKPRLFFCGNINLVCGAAVVEFADVN